MQGHGTAPEAQTVWNGEAVTEPTTVPTAQGYQFDGWCTNAAGTNAYNFATALSDDITLYAKWTALPNTISFETDGKGTPVSAQTVASGQTVTEPPVQFYYDANDGKEYGIEGWYTDAAHLQRYDFSTPVDHDITLYAKWVVAGMATFNVTSGGTVTLIDAQGRTPNADGWLIPGQYTLTVAPQSNYTYSGNYTLRNRSEGHEQEQAIVGITEHSYSVNLTEEDVTVNIVFSTQPIVSINVATDGNVTPGSWTLIDGFGNSYANGSNVTVPGENNANPNYVMKLNINKGEGNSKSYEVSIVNDGKTTTYSNTALIEIDPRGSIDIELFFYDTTTGVVTLNDDDSNTNIISSAIGKKRMVTLSGRTLKKDGNWNTICLPFDVALDGSRLNKATLMELDIEGTHDDTYQTGFDDGTLRLYFKTAKTIKAGKPYLIKWERPSNYSESKDISNPSFAGVTISSETPTGVTSSDGSVTFTGSYDPVNIAAEDRSILYLGAASTLYYPSGATNIGSCRAHFELNGLEAGTQTTSRFVLNFGEESTGITDAEANSSFFILHSSSSEWFTLDGRRLQGKPTSNGLYIHNGRKVVIKQ